MKVIDTYNAIVGAAVAVLSYIFGEHWILFALFLAFNVADWITGWMKARLTHKENSKAGWKGVLKKLAYWIMIAVAFGALQCLWRLERRLALIWESPHYLASLSWHPCW